MAFPDPIVIEHPTGTEKSFSITQRLPDGQIRMDQATDLSTPNHLTIKHQKTGNARDGLTDRHLLGLSRTERDPDTGKLYTCHVNLSVSVPRTTLFTVSEVEVLVGQLIALLEDETIDTLPRLLRSES